MFEQKTDVLIIGGGLSGLSAALTLKEHGIPSLLLESEGRLGGRVRTENLSGLPAEMGGERIGLDDSLLIAYCRRFNLPLLNRSWSHEILGADGSLEKLPQSYHEKMADLTSSPQNPSRSLNDVNWSAFLEQRGFDPNSLKIASIMGRLIYGCDISTFPAADILSDTQEGVFKTANSLWIQGGNRRLVDTMAINLDPEVVRLRLNSAVTSLKQNSSGVEVTCVDGTIFNSKIAILALPTPALDAITFSPNLPGHLKDALKAVDYAHILKSACSFPNKFWPDDFELIQEDTPNSIYNAGEVLIAYTVYDTAGELAGLTEEEGKRQMISTLRKCFPTIPEPSSYKVKMWANAFSIYKEDSFEQVKATLSLPWDNVFFAGEHMPPDAENQGYMNGAIASGEFAALEAMKILV